ncbi:hypothetical protein AB0L44_15105 [Nonomuraea wenchangensis]|uniref:hypothetical protein n=1 Tax=Nonomuraea wenchangensis TaxID=568860 RepID=UPI003445A27A
MSLEPLPSHGAGLRPFLAGYSVGSVVCCALARSSSSRLINRASLAAARINVFVSASCAF